MARSSKQAPPGLPRQRMPMRVLPPASAELRQRALAALTLGVLSLLGLAFIGNLKRGFYVVAMTLVFALIAICLGVSASRAARRSGTARPRGAFSGTLLGAFGLGLSLIWLLVLTVFWSQLSTYATCIESASTVTAQQACQSQLSKSISNEISILQSGR
jgi:hypothetical protein